MRHFGSQNLKTPPTSSGRVLRIQLPKPRNFDEKVAMAEIYLSPYWQGRLRLEPVEEVVRTCQHFVHQRLLSRIQADREYLSRIAKEAERQRLIVLVKRMLAEKAERERQRWLQRQEDLRWIEEEVARLRQERANRERAEQRRREEEERRKREDEERQRQRQQRWRFCFVQFDDLSRHYRTLGIPEGSSRDEVKRAYHRLALLTHPDQCASHGLDVATANERFRAVNEAYQALTA